MLLSCIFSPVSSVFVSLDLGAEAMFADLGHFSVKSIQVKL